MKRLFIITLITFLFKSLPAQMPVGAWADRLSYNTARCIAISPDEIYASTGSSVLVFNKEFNELKKISPVNGLSETGISAIGWSEEYNTLIVAYNSTNLDLISKNSLFNIPDVMNKYIPGNKRINRIRTLGKYAYLATGFGIVVVDFTKNEIHDTWKPGPGPENNEVFDIAFGNNRIYAATNFGTWYADQTNQGLAYFGNWSQVDGLPDPDSKCSNAIYSLETLYINVSDPISGDRVYAVDNTIRLFSFNPGVANTSFDYGSEGFTFSSSGSVKYFRHDGSPIATISSYGWGTPNISQGIIVNKDVWIADINNGLVRGRNLIEYTSLSLPGPSSDEVVNIISANGKTIICGGGADDSWDRLNRSFQVSVFENNQFTNIIASSAGDAMRSLSDPSNSSRFFVSTWGDGLLEFNTNTLIKHYNSTNSPLQESVTPGSGIKICGLAIDGFKNLWITQTDVPENVKILKPDGTWIIYPLKIDAPVAGDIISTQKGQKWITLPGGHGLYIIDDHKTPELFSDDQTRKLTVIDNDDKLISSVFTAAEDHAGNIWIGTDQGPVIYFNASNIFEEDVRGYRIKIPRNDGSGLADYMLGTESITAIAVDGANRKWLGTMSSGAYLLSADGTSVLKNYNRQNSPIFSDSIATIAIDNLSGEVWFGTSGGVVSVREIATSGNEEFQDVYSFPNPVREDFSGSVTITGLMKETFIKITDVSGNLVFETISEGGQAAWDLTTYNGRRVSTGIYLVFCSNNDGSKSFVTKILVIGQ